MRASILFAILLGIYSNAIAIDGFDEETGTLSWPQYKQGVEADKVKRINMYYADACQEEGLTPSRGWFPFSKNHGKLLVNKFVWWATFAQILNVQQKVESPGAASLKDVAQRLHAVFPKLKMIVMMDEVAQTEDLGKIAETLLKDGGGILLYNKDESATLKPSKKVEAPTESTLTTSTNSASTSLKGKGDVKATKSSSSKASKSSEDDPDDDTSDYFAVIKDDFNSDKFTVVQDGVRFHNGGSTDWSTSTPCSQPSTLRSSPSYYSDEYTSC